MSRFFSSVALGKAKCVVQFAPYARASVICVLAVIISNGNPILAQDHSKRPSLGIIKSVKVTGCGCYFGLPNQDINSDHYIFFEDFSEKYPVMNINGRNVRLRLISSNEPNRTKR